MDVPSATAATTRPAFTTFPFSVEFGTAPCSGWTLLVGDKWAVRDAVTGRVIDDAGSVYPGRCGFSVQFHLSASTYGQYAQVFVYDPEDQLLGLNESNAGDSRVLVKGDGGPYAFSRDGVVSGASLIDCADLPSVCLQTALDGSAMPPPPTTGYSRYTNPRFGFTTLWPSAFTEQDPPEDGDGTEWSFAGGAVSLTTYGSNNTNGATPAADLRAVSSGLDVTYSNVSGDIVTVSGYKGDSIIYERDVVGVGSIDTLLWKYPSTQRARWQAATTKTAFAFTSGNVSSTH